MSGCGMRVGELEGSPALRDTEIIGGGVLRVERGMVGKNTGAGSKCILLQCESPRKAFSSYES